MTVTKIFIRLQIRRLHFQNANCHSLLHVLPYRFPNNLHNSRIRNYNLSCCFIWMIYNTIKYAKPREMFLFEATSDILRLQSRFALMAPSLPQSAPHSRSTSFHPVSNFQNSSDCLPLPQNKKKMQETAPTHELSIIFF